MICQSPETAYIGEPFHYMMAWSWLGRDVPHWFQYVCADNEAGWTPGVDNIVSLRYPLTANLRRVRDISGAMRVFRDGAKGAYFRIRGARSVIKDPMAIFALPWLSERYCTANLVLIRHPVAFVGSFKRLGWRIDARKLLDQPLLMRDWLEPHRDALEWCAREERPIVDEASVLWRVIYAVVDRYRTLYPDWIFMRYEDIARAPLASFQTIFEKIGLPWDDVVKERIGRFTDEGNVKDVPRRKLGTIKRDSRSAVSVGMKRLDQNEIERVYQRVADVSGAFYSDDDWKLSGRRSGS